MAGGLMPVFARATHAVSSLGYDTAQHWRAVQAQQSGIRYYEDAAYGNTSFWASMPDPAGRQLIHNLTRGGGETLTPFEQLAAFSALQALQQADLIPGPDTAFVLSTTKGNIELLDQGAGTDQLLLSHSARVVAARVGILHALVVSHACVSGVIALQYAAGLIRSGRYRHVVVTGCDRFSRFVLSGFRSFQAVADGPCRPFDAQRAGISLGEAAATVVLSADPGDMPLARLAGGSTSNDANHISGPSRTGDELAMAITRALRQAEIGPADVGMVSAHGTATLYNDEMEAKAFHTAGLGGTPVHSLKGYVGHTLGAAGVLESVLVLEAMQQGCLIPSAGYDRNGVSQELQITTFPEAADLRYVLKTASGFGGCNATLVWAQAAR